MTCQQYGGQYLDILIDANENLGRAAVDFVTCPVIDQFGAPLAALLAFAPLALAFYVNQQSLGMPLIITIITGAIIMPFMPPQVIQLVIVALLLVGPIAMMFLIRRARLA